MEPDLGSEIRQLRDELRQQRTTPEFKLARLNLRVTIVLGVIATLLVLLQPSPEVGRFVVLVVIEFGILVLVAGLLLRAIDRSLLRPDTVLLLIVVSITSFPRDIVRWHKDLWSGLWSPLRQASAETAAVPASPPSAIAQAPQGVPSAVVATVAAQMVLIVVAAQPLFVSGRDNEVAPTTRVAQVTDKTPTMPAAAVLSPTPSCTPSPVVLTHAPSFLSPDEGQPLDFEGAYIFEVRPEPGAEGYLWGFEQNGKIGWDTMRDGAAVEGPTYGIQENSPAHAQFRPGDLTVIVRAFTCDAWSEAATRRFVLVPRNDPTPTVMPTPDCRITETCP